MKTRKESHICLIALFSIISIIFNNKNPTAESIKRNSGKFMLIETPESKQSPDFLVVEKVDGKKSLIKVDEETENEKSSQSRSVSRLKKEGEICGRCIGTFCMPGCKPAEDWGQDCGKCEKGLVCRLSLPGSSSCTKVSTDLLACDGKKCADSCRFDGNVLGSCNQDGKCVQGDGLNCECSGDLVYSDCHSACEPRHFCGTDHGEGCILVCRKGCGCPRGLIRSFQNSTTCINKSECKGKRCEKKKCTKNEDCEVLNNQGININKDCGFEVCYTGKGHPLEGHCGPALY